MYYIVRKDGLPGNDGSEILGAACAIWAESQDKANTEVVEADLLGNVIRRYSHRESGDIAHQFRNPSIR
jgi:hypothetical protein